MPSPGAADQPSTQTRSEPPTRAEIDPSTILTATEFAASLAALTRRQVRGLAEKSGVPRSTISSWTTGQHVPNPNQIDQLRRLLAAVGLADGQQTAWTEAALRVRRSPGQRGPDRTRSAPYLGLEPFAETDADRFFGREDVVAAVVDQVQAVRHDPAVEHRVVFLVGASGEGKSSIVRAGVAVALAALPETTVSVISPTFDEGTVLDGAGADQVVIVDQFEEVFSSARTDLLTSIVSASAADGGPTVLAAVRSDFYPRLIELPAFTASLVSHQLVLSPMDHESMRRAIVEPARRAGVDIEPGLVEMMLNDVAPATSLDDRPNIGVLPLLSHALLETWSRGSGRQLQVADYVALGGLNGAIEKTAELAYGKLDPLGAEAARDLFRRLVNIDADGLITRRHAGLDEIAEADGGDGLLTSVMWHFVEARLLTVEATTITLSHEVLLRAWSRLRSWVSDERDDIRLHRELAAVAGGWSESGDDEGGLLAGGRLERARTWLASPVGSRLAGPDERRLIEASEERARRRAAQDRRRFRRLVALAAATSAAALIAGIATIDASNSRREAQDARIEAEVRDLSNRASTVADPYVAAFYALEATQWTDSPLTVARSAWLRSAQRIGRLSLFRSGFDLEFAAADLAFSPDGKLLAALGRDGAIRLIDPISRESVASSEPTPIGTALAWSPDGDRIVTSRADGTISVFSAETLADAPATTDVATTTANDVTFSPDGSTIAVTNNEGSLVLLDADSLEPRGEPISTGSGAAQRVCLASRRNDDRDDELPRRADDGRPSRGAPVRSVLLAGGVVANGLAWNPDGTVVAVTSSDGMVRYFEPSALEQLGPPVSTGSSYALNVIWSPDGSRLAGSNQDGKLRVFTAVDHLPTGDPVLTGTGGTSAIAWSPSDDLIVTANEDGNIRFFEVPRPVERSTIYGARAALSPDGTTLVTTNFDDTIRMYDTAALEPIGDLVPAGGTDLSAIAWSPDGERIAVGSTSGEVSTFDRSDPSSRRLVDEGSDDPVSWIGWTGDGSAVATASAGGRVAVRDAETSELLREVDLGVAVAGGALDPGADVLAVSAADGTVRLLALDDLGQRGDPIVTGSKEATNVAWSTDGRKLATVNDDGTIRIVSASGSATEATYTLPVSPTRIAWSPADDLLAVGTGTGATWLFSTTGLEPIGTATTTGSAVTALHWMPDGTMVIASHANGYTVRSRSWAASAACASLRSVLPEAEMVRLLDIPEASSHCMSGRVNDLALPSTTGRTP